jgi:hypothetical protein
MENVYALWEAVLLRAIADWVLYKGRTDMTGRMIWRGANQWLFGPDQHLFNSFDAVCDILGWRPEAFREKIRRLTPEEVTRIRSRRR